LRSGVSGNIIQNNKKILKSKIGLTLMAVVYMRKLEQEPDTYDSQFTALTKGVNLEVREWILDKIGNSKTILEVGCGTGSLASQMALKGNNVTAIDVNFQMINYAMQNYPSDLKEGSLLYQTGSFSNMPVEANSQDLVVSTFMLSELRPFEQQIFLRNAWKVLKPNGSLLIAESKTHPADKENVLKHFDHYTDDLGLRDYLLKLLKELDYLPADFILPQH